VGFRYDVDDPEAAQALRSVSLDIAAGEMVALVGGSGSGKTTLASLLPRFYDVCSGRILLDGVDLRDYSIVDLQSQIGVIFQDFMRYEMSARDNIAVGLIERQDDLESIESAARKSLADEVIGKLPLSFA